MKNEEIGSLGMAIIDAEKRRFSDCIKPVSVLASKSGSGVVVYVPTSETKLVDALRLGKYKADCSGSKMSIFRVASTMTRAANLGRAVRYSHGVEYFALCITAEGVESFENQPNFALSPVEGNVVWDPEINGILSINISVPAKPVPPKIVNRGKKKQKIEQLAPVVEENTVTPEQVKEAVRVINRFLAGPRADELEIYISPSDKMLKGSFREFFQ